jgi:hypothetical protein
LDRIKRRTWFDGQEFLGLGKGKHDSAGRISEREVILTGVVRPVAILAWPANAFEQDEPDFARIDFAPSGFQEVWHRAVLSGSGSVKTNRAQHTGTLRVEDTIRVLMVHFDEA